MLLVIIIFNIVQGIDFSSKELLSSLLCQQWYKYSMPESGHLWYITCILFCYLITPILQLIGENINRLSDAKYWGVIGVGIVFFQLIQSLGGFLQNVYSIFP